LDIQVCDLGGRGMLYNLPASGILVEAFSVVLSDLMQGCSTSDFEELHLVLHRHAQALHEHMPEAIWHQQGPEELHEYLIAVFGGRVLCTPQQAQNIAAFIFNHEKLLVRRLDSCTEVNPSRLCMIPQLSLSCTSSLH
jgi:hypothetical protein